MAAKTLSSYLPRFLRRLASCSSTICTAYSSTHASITSTVSAFRTVEGR